MIELTRLNNQVFILNALYIEQVQAFPDTTITLLNGRKLVVKESVKEVGEKATVFYSKVGIAPILIHSEKETRKEDDEDDV